LGGPDRTRVLSCEEEGIRKDTLALRGSLTKGEKKIRSNLLSEARLSSYLTENHLLNERGGRLFNSIGAWERKEPLTGGGDIKIRCARKQKRTGSKHKRGVLQSFWGKRKILILAERGELNGAAEGGGGEN